MTFDGVRRDEIEDQAIFCLKVTMNSSHPLLQPIGIPRDVIVEQDVTALEVDAFPGSFGGDKNLNRPFPELLFSVQPRTRLVPRADVHATVNRANGEIPLL